MFDAAIAAALPARVVPPHLPSPSRGRTIVLGAGKASAAMARAVEDNWNGELEGLVVTRYGHGAPCARVEIVEAAHPVPDTEGRDAARRILELARSAGPDDLVLCLISGGGSALLALPADGLTLEHKQSINRALLRSGAAIDEMNCVRKHLSAIKGGRLAAAAHPAKVVSLLISDVPCDDPAVIASGPTVPDPTTFADALAVLRKYDIREPKAALDHLAAAAEETPKPGDPRLASTSNVTIATPQRSLEAAAEVARRAGVAPLILGDAIEGEAREVARVMAGIALQAARSALGRRDHGHGTRPRPRRPQYRAPARARDRAGRPSRRPRHRRRHRWDRRQRGQCGGCGRSRHPRSRPGARPRRQGAARRQRRLRPVQRARRPRGDRADAHQRQRFSRRAGALSR
jgi:hydroxypyruvate reductase